MFQKQYRMKIRENRVHTHTKGEYCFRKPLYVSVYVYILDSNIFLSVDPCICLCPVRKENIPVSLKDRI